MRLKARLWAATAAASLGLLVCDTANAVKITSAFTNLGGGSGAYDYSVENDDLDAGVSGITVYFAAGRYSNLTASGPADWDSLAVDPDTGIPDDGFGDWLALGSPIAKGSTLAGFRVEFDFSGPGVPENQSFEIYVLDPEFDIVAEGRTELAGAPVPAPETISLLLLGLLGTVVMRPRRRLRAVA